MKRIGIRTPANRLSRYWNAVAGGAPAEDVNRLADGIDPDLLSDIALVRRGHARHVPDPSFVQALEDRLMQSMATSPSVAQPLPASVHPPANGRVSDRVWPARPPDRPQPARRLSGAALATAVFAVLILIGSIVVLFSVNSTGDQSTGGNPTVAHRRHLPPCPCRS